MQRVLVVSSTRQQLMPCSPARARQLLTQRKAAVLRRYPFTIILKYRKEGDVQPMQFKVDPGSKTTGVVLVACFVRRGPTVVWGGEITHRGKAVRDALLARRALRRGRRYRKTRYREARFLNRTKPSGWLPPSIESRISNILTWFNRLRSFSPVSSIAIELVKFDTQALQNPEIVGIEYQRGTLFGFELREYLLMKFGHRCVYCDSRDIPLEIEHVVSRSKGGSDRASNLVLSCRPCNLSKGNMHILKFLSHDETRLNRILKQLKFPLHDAAAMNATRYALRDMLALSGLPIEAGTGGRTKFNRTQQGYPKVHWIDAACVGESGTLVSLEASMKFLRIASCGHGNRQMCGTNKFGFPVRHRTRQKRHFGFQTGEMVKAIVPAGKHRGMHKGKVFVRASGYFDIKTTTSRIGGINHRHCSLLNRADGYNYS